MLGSEYKDSWYKQVIEACALDSDIKVHSILLLSLTENIFHGNVILTLRLCLLDGANSFLKCLKKYKFMLFIIFIIFGYFFRIFTLD